VAANNTAVFVCEMRRVSTEALLS